MDEHERPALSVEVRPTIGADIKEIAPEMVRLANMWGTSVRTKFNGCDLWARAGDTAEDIEKLYRYTLEA